MRALSDTELELVRLRSNLPMLRRAQQRAQFLYAAARKGQLKTREAALKSATLAVMKAEMRLFELEGQSA